MHTFKTLKYTSLKKINVYVKLSIYSNKEESKFYIELQLRKYCMLVIELGTYRLDWSLRW